MNKSNNVPQIRFKGFSEPWENYVLSDLGKIETGNTPSTLIKDYYSEEGMLWVTPTDITSNILTDTEKKLSEKGVEVARVVSENSILCTCIASIGKNIFTQVKCAFNQQINALTPFNNHNPYFLFTNSYHWSKEMKRQAAGLTFQIINKTEFSHITTSVPSKKEQEKIGSLFERLDNMINLQKEKHKQLKNIKKSLLENMFPSEGEDVLKIRFKGFNEPWTIQDLGKNGEFKSNGVDKLIKPNEMPVNLLNYMDVYNRRKITNNNANELMQVTAKLSQIRENNVLKGDVFFTPTSETADDIGNVMVIEENLDNTVYSYHLMRYRPYKNVFYLTFPNYAFATPYVRKQMELSAQGVQRFVISKKGFEEIKVAYPSIKEQKKIANLLTNLDNKINHTEELIDKLEEIKKSLLDKMFV